MLSNGLRLPSERGMSLEFIQIFYNDDQVKHLYSFASPYKNEVVTDFFENKIIAERVPAVNAEYIGVCSWRLREKRQSGKCPIILGITNADDLSKEKILSSGADIINLRPFSPSHQMLANAAMWHGGPQHNYAWENAIEELRTFIHIPDEVKIPIYENAFTARGSIYVDYVVNCLAPVMDFMSTRPVFFADGGYAEKKARTEPNSVEDYKKMTGRNDWPIAPFVLERLFSIWINNRNYSIVNL